MSGGDHNGVPADRTPDQIEDEQARELVTRAQAGDRDAFNALYARYFDRVYTYLHTLLKDRHEAEDATQHVFLQVFRALPSYEHRRSFWVWLFTVVRNHALNVIEKKGRLDPEDPVRLNHIRDRTANGDEAAATALTWVTDRDLLLFVDRLPIPQRQVLLLRYMLDLSFVEIGDILGRPASDVRLLHHRALDFLRIRLSAVGREPRATRDSPSYRRIRQSTVLRSRRWSLTP